MRVCGAKPASATVMSHAPDAQRRQEEAALAVGHALDDRAARRMGRRHGGARQHAAGRVHDDAGHFTSIGLRSGDRCERDDDRDQSREY